MKKLSRKVPGFFLVLALLFLTFQWGRRNSLAEYCSLEISQKQSVLANYQVLNNTWQAYSSIREIANVRDWYLEGITITTYAPVVGQTDDSPMRTSTGDIITEDSYYKWVGVSQDLLNKYVNYGDSIFITFYGDTFGDDNSYIDTTWSGWYIVMDRTNIRFKNTIDILIPATDTKNIFSVKATVTNYLNKEIYYEP